MTVKCELCGSAVEAANRPVEIAEDGFPVAVTLTRGLPVPYAKIHMPIRLYFNDVEQKGCVAFDRNEGAIWRYVRNPSDCFVVEDGHLKIEKVFGSIRLEHKDKV